MLGDALSVQISFSFFQVGHVLEENVMLGGVAAEAFGWTGAGLTLRVALHRTCGHLLSLLQNLTVCPKRWHLKHLMGFGTEMSTL